MGVGAEPLPRARNHQTGVTDRIRRSHIGAAVVTLVATVGCGGPGNEVLHQELSAILAEQRTAHLETDPSAMVENIADSLLSVDAGVVSVQARRDVEAMFASYFEGAVYRRWEDVTPPIVRLSSDGSMAWVVRTVLVQRDEPDGTGGTRSHQFTSAYTSTFERMDGRWQMTSVTSTFLPPDSAASIVP